MTEQSLIFFPYTWLIRTLSHIWFNQIHKADRREVWQVYRIIFFFLRKCFSFKLGKIDFVPNLVRGMGAKCSYGVEQFIRIRPNSPEFARSLLIPDENSDLTAALLNIAAPPSRFASHCWRLSPLATILSTLNHSFMSLLMPKRS